MLLLFLVLSSFFLSSFFVTVRFFLLLLLLLSSPLDARSILFAFACRSALLVRKSVEKGQKQRSKERRKRTGLKTRHYCHPKPSLLSPYLISLQPLPRPNFHSH